MRRGARAIRQRRAPVTRRMSRTRIINSKARKLKVGENAGNGAWVEDAAPRPNDRSGDSPSASSSSIEFITTPRRAFPRGAITRVARAPQTASPPRRTLALPRALLAAATFAATARHALATEALISHDLPREDSVTTSPASFEARGRVFRARKSGATVANDTRTRSVTLSELADCLLQLRRREPAAVRWWLGLVPFGLEQANSGNSQNIWQIPNFGVTRSRSRAQVFVGELDPIAFGAGCSS